MVDKAVVIFMGVSIALISASMYATILLVVWYVQKKAEYEKEIQHLKKERDTCRSLLQKRGTQDGS